MKILSMPASSGVSSDQIIKNGVISPAYTVSGNITQGPDYIELQRIGGSTVLTVIGVDMTDRSTINLEVYCSTSSYNNALGCNGLSAIFHNTSYEVITLNVSGVTGVKNITIDLGNAAVHAFVRNLIVV